METNSANNPLPPTNLNKEEVGIWISWGCKGDREIAREAAAKGLRELGVRYLSDRKNILKKDADNYFLKEVIIWINELLNRKQIFRVSHILNNIGLDAATELEKIFCTTTKKEMREYVGNHLEKIEKLSEHHKTLWNFLDLITRNAVLTMRNRLEEESIDCLAKQDKNWKNKIAGKLFLRTSDISLIPFLEPEAIWKLLLIYNDTKLLRDWIYTSFNDYGQGSVNTSSDNLHLYFKEHALSVDFINTLASAESSSVTRHSILNEFSKYGIFNDSDKTNIENILYRISQSDNILNIYRILDKAYSNVGQENFLLLLIDYCVINCLPTVLNSCLKNFEVQSLLRERKDSLELNLIQSFRNATKFTQDDLFNNIYFLSKFLSEGKTNKFFREHPLIFLSLLILNKEFSNKNIMFNTNINILGEDYIETLEEIKRNFTLLKAICAKCTEPQNTKHTHYSLLEKHLKIDVEKLFFRPSMPHFNDRQLSKEYGYSKKIDFTFYLKQCRPSIASKLFIINTLRLNDSSENEHQDRAQKKAFKICISNLESHGIVVSCIAFLEMIGKDSQFLRTSVHVAQLLLQAGFDSHLVKNLFMNIENEFLTIQNNLEEIILSKFDFNYPLTGEEFVNVVKQYEVAVKFSFCNNSSLPELLLKKLANHNLWFEFLLFAQIKNYPTEQISTILPSLKNPNLLDHIGHSVVHDIQVNEQNVLMRERDPRKYFLSRIGVRRSIESISQGTDSPYSSLRSPSSASLRSNSSSAGSDFLEADILNVKSTLLQTLIKCHNSADPPRALLQACQLYKNPLLAIFATSYEPDSIITNWITWVAVSSELYRTFTNFESVTTSAQAVSNLLNNCMKKKYPKMLLRSFEIFIPDNPLKIMVQVLTILLKKHSDLQTLHVLLDEFKEVVKNLRRRSVLGDNDYELTYLKNKIWIESTALQLISSAIEYNCHSVYEQLKFLETLCNLNLESYFSIETPSFTSLLEILRNVYDSQSDIRFSVSEYFDENTRKGAVVKCINRLLDLKYFKIALDIAKVAKLPVDLILIKEWQTKFEHRNPSSYNDFWEKCNKDFTKYNLSADTTVYFFLDCVDKVEDTYEKYILYELSWNWSRKYNMSNQHQLERKKWIMYVNLDPKWKEMNYEVINIQPPNLTYRDMLETLKDIPEYEEELPSNCKVQLEKIQMEALNIGNFWLALKLEKLFNCKSSDMEILKVCHSLAEGMVMPYQLNVDQRLLLSRGRTLRRYSQRSFLSTKYSMSSSASFSTVNPSSPQANDDLDRLPNQEIVSLLQTLAEKLNNGSEIAYNIYMTYRISINIEIPYHVVVSNSDYMKMLKDALEDDCMNKLEVVHDFIKSYKWSNEEIADFICEEIVNSVSKCVNSRAEHLTMWDLNLNQELHLILQLLQDNCSILGYKIYSYASALHKVQVSANLNYKISELSLVVELLIIAHECFTADCNMEGISIILKKCQTVISHLLTLRSWKLIVHLLTGVGRYTEMNYVFQILKENDQFEFLLKKGSRKDSALKTALLEYLKKYCPENKELYNMVALHFTLFSEVAMLWEREAQSIIRNLIAISKLEMQNNKLNPETEPFVLFSNTDGTNFCLNRAMENYTHATEFHLQGEKLAKAMNAAKQAELLALQKSLLKNLTSNGFATCILNLNIPQIATLISTQLSFQQSQILVQAYNYQADWAYVLFEQCIKRKNIAYLGAFLQNIPLTDSLVRDISRKFISANIDTPQEIKCMKQILVNLPSVHTKYRIASELGFTDVVEDLIIGGQLAYLKDTVWKKGYKRLE